MFVNYFRIAFRNLVKNKVHSIINIVGLSVGMAVAMLIGLWIWDELSFNKYHQHYDRIAQVMQSQTFNGEKGTGKATPIPLGTELRQSYGNDFKYVVRSSWTWEHILAMGDKKLLQRGYYMEPDAPALLSLKMVRGTGAGLKDPSSILLNASLAKALFGDADPMGQTVKLDNSGEMKVTGVYEDLPPNTNFKDLSFIAPWDYYAAAPDMQRAKNDWGNNSFQLFVMLADKADMATVSARIKNAKLNKVGKEDARYKPEIFLQPMSNWHLYSEFKNGVNVGGRIRYVWLFGIIGSFILLLACINFMNLSTARSEKRAKEVGIRKTIGSLRIQLIGQFFSESLLIALLAFVFSLVLVELSLPFFNGVADKQITILWNNPLFWLMGIGFSLITGLVAGSYPAIYLSSFQPIKVLKGTFRAGPLAAIPRRVLVVLQFTVSMVMIIGTLIVFRQVEFARDRPIGYSRDGLLMIPEATADLHNHLYAFREDLLKTGAIAEIAESSSPMTEVENNTSGMDWKGKDPNMTDDFATIGVTTEYGRTVGWQFKEGRDFSKIFATDSSGVVLNEAAVKYMSLKNPVGETLKWWKNFKIIGVIHDMVMQSPYEPVKQSIFYIDNRPGDYIMAKINPNTSATEALNKIGVISKKYAPSAPFTYKFADEEYNKKFDGEVRIGKLASFFAILAIFISCVGLFGMASFTAEQR